VRTTPGFFLLTGICGVIDAVCFLALGGVFAEIMTGNLMFAAFALGEGRFAVDFVQFAVPLVCFTVGAVVGGYVLRNQRFAGHRRTGFVIAALLVAVAALLAVAWEPSGTSTSARVVVGILALAMGLQNALVLTHGVPDVATNVMTLTLVRVLSNWSILGGDNARWNYRVGSIAAFVAGAATGAFLVRFGAAAGLVAAAVLYAVALVWLLKGKSPSAVTP
jgi:uncharacterized membrane protein YoaK (UPF0700 family)